MLKNRLFKKFFYVWKIALNRLFFLGNISTNNEVEIYNNGDQAFLSINNAINLATKYIIIETYILAYDRLTHWLSLSLIKAAKNGVRVFILYDHLGSTMLSNNFIEHLSRQGIKIQSFNPIWPWRRKGPLLWRNHRKIIVIDGQIAFCGGMNLTKDYAGPIYGNNRFRDSMVKLKGDAVLDLQDLALQNIDEIFENDFILKKKFPKKKGVAVQVLQSNRRKNISQIQKSMQIVLSTSIDYCYFTSPYFLPYEKLRKAILKATKRGVDVRICTAGMSDVPLMRYASHHVYFGFLKAGVKIYEMDKQILHAKTATIDGVYACVGSYNLDHWSARRNLEVNVSFFNKNIAKELKEQFLKDIDKSKNIKMDDFNKRSIFKRFFCWCAYQIMRL